MNILTAIYRLLLKGFRRTENIYLSFHYLSLSVIQQQPTTAAIAAIAAIATTAITVPDFSYCTYFW